MEGGGRGEKHPNITFFSRGKKNGVGGRGKKKPPLIALFRGRGGRRKGGCKSLKRPRRDESAVKSDSHFYQQNCRTVKSRYENVVGFFF